MVQRTLVVKPISTRMGNVTLITPDI